MHGLRKNCFVWTLMLTFYQMYIHLSHFNATSHCSLHLWLVLTYGATWPYYWGSTTIGKWILFWFLVHFLFASFMAAFLAFEPSRLKLYFSHSVHHILDVLPPAAQQDNRFWGHTRRWKEKITAPGRIQTHYFFIWVVWSTAEVQPCCWQPHQQNRSYLILVKYETFFIQ